MHQKVRNFEQQRINNEWISILVLNNNKNEWWWASVVFYSNLILEVQYLKKAESVRSKPKSSVKLSDIDYWIMDPFLMGIINDRKTTAATSTQLKVRDGDTTFQRSDWLHFDDIWLFIFIIFLNFQVWMNKSEYTQKKNH